MIERLKEMSFYLLVGYALAGASLWLQSAFLMKFLSENLIVVLVALTAINTTTSSVVMTKLREISDANGADFSRSIQAFRGSMIEQVWHLAVALAASMLYGSVKLKAFILCPEFTIGGLLATVFVASMANLHDTGQSIFVLLRYEKKHT
jgi:hypothetical protein